MTWKDIINNTNQWTGLRLEINKGSAPKLQLESGNNCRFKLYNNNEPLLWGTFGSEYWGVWILNNKRDWELNDRPVTAIQYSIIEESKKTDYYKFWSRFFAKQLCGEKSSSLSNGLWTITIGASWEHQMGILLK